ncbi:hypothetical protein [Pseudomonas sp. GW456-12-1-14-TSB6]|uniref:hypothetical protein n=1 Tax=Pseudomonas sp. GW456-12-1-14-TSB6 TaxID=2751350 RepID=UPI0013047EE3|nr:hypothetical protein [Pseudomonas sp. GW456-12-1-14-TSB6]
MKKYAVVKNGVVDNLIIWDGDLEGWQPPAGTIAIEIPDSSPVSIGYLYNGSEFVESNV